MPKPILVANWKNYPNSLAEAKSLLQALARGSAKYKKLNVFIAPPLSYLSLVAEKSKSFAQLASQDIPLEVKGSHTGAITPSILKSFGVRLSIIGHSELRAVGQTDREVSEKVRTALKSGITPLVCVGEAVHDADGAHFDFIRQQIKSSLEGVKKSEVEGIIIAYEPVWSIGKSAKDAISPADLSQTVIFIKKVLSDTFGRSLAENVRIIYGGSVEPSNADALRDTGVNGFLVGHASLNYKDFLAIADSLA